MHVTTSISDFKKTLTLQEFHHGDLVQRQGNTNSSLLATSYIYQQGSWDAGASNLTEEYRVLLFTIPKVGRTVLKQWCQRLNHLPPQLQKVWYTSNSQKKGLCYLYYHSPDQVMEMLS
jgi:hypothetical protein